jgi:UPF0755 protein
MKSLRRLLAIALLGLAALAGYAAWYVSTAVRIQAVPVVFEIPAGSGLRAAIRHMERAGVEPGRLRFELLARAAGRAGAIKAGNYEISSGITPLELLDQITRGLVTQAEITFIEGWTFLQLRAALDQSPDLRHDSRGMSDAALLERIGAGESHPEGLFFPDTYLFARHSSDLAVLRRAYHAMQRHLAEEWRQRATDLPYKTPYDALILASIVEKETGRGTDRGEIAGVLVNRLRIGMALQTDPAVIYGLGERFDGNLKRAHLTADGPYNTYTRRGLPPTPISLPGLAAMRATLQPDRTKALYFVSRGDGTTQFSRSLEEHNRAVSKYQLQPRKK